MICRRKIKTVTVQLLILMLLFGISPICCFAAAGDDTGTGAADKIGVTVDDTSAAGIGTNNGNGSRNGGTAEGSDITSDMIDQQLSSSGTGDIGDVISKYTNSEGLKVLEGFDPDELIKNITEGKLSFDIKGIGDNILKLFFNELYQNLGILLKLAILIVICSLLKNLQANFMNENVSRIAFYVCYIVIVTILLVSFSTVVRMGTSIIDQMVGFMYATIPVLMALLISGGNITAGGILHPVLLMVVEVTATLIKNLFVPLIFLTTIINIVNNISEKIQLQRLASLIKTVVQWMLGIILTTFIIIVTLQGTLGAVIDGATTKATKFAISTFIPVIGKTLSDAADTVIACTLLIKNAAGVAAMIGILLICLVPLIKIIALVALYKAASALFEPISESRITTCINDVAGSMLYIFSLTAAVAFMFIISVTALVSAGNTSAMLR